MYLQKFAWSRCSAASARGECVACTTLLQTYHRLVSSNLNPRRVTFAAHILGSWVQSGLQIAECPNILTPMTADNSRYKYKHDMSTIEREAARATSYRRSCIFILCRLYTPSMPSSLPMMTAPFSPTTNVVE